jgi:integrase/recombinase XerD
MTALCLPVDDWPEIDRERWRWAQQPAGFLEDDKPATRWSPARRRIVEQAYGQWLSWLDRNDALDPSCTPGERATNHRLSEFVAELRARVAPVSAAMMLGSLVRMLSVLEPERDWGPLARVYNHLKQTAAPSRDKLSRLVRASDLFELGISLMNTCESGADRPVYVGIRYRDGLIIALLIACPMRIKNLANLVIGQHLVFDGCEYRLKLSAAETKTGRPYHAAVPPELTPYIDRWLQVHRPKIQALGTRKGQVGSVGSHLWLDRSGRPMRSGAIREQIKARTRQAFGRHVWPHLFRDCAVTELVDCAPEEIGIAPDLLGHADLQTTKKHYIQAVGMKAHALVQEVIAARRRAATSRDSTGTSRA